MPRCRLCLVALVALAACDTDNPSSAILDEVEGTYDVTELLFEPITQALDSANVAARLVPSQTSLQLQGSGRTFFFFELEGRPSDVAEFTASPTSSGVRLTARTEVDAEALIPLLFPSASFTLTYDDERGTLSGVLQAGSGNPVNLQAFDPQLYQGQTAEQGTLLVTFTRRGRG